MGMRCWPNGASRNVLRNGDTPRGSNRPREGEEGTPPARLLRAVSRGAGRGGRAVRRGSGPEAGGSSRSARAARPEHPGARRAPNEAGDCPPTLQFSRRPQAPPDLLPQTPHSAPSPPRPSLPDAPGRPQPPRPGFIRRALPLRFPSDDRPPRHRLQRLHPHDRRRRRRRRQARRPRRHALPPRAQRLPPHRPRQVDRPQLRRRPRVGRHLQPPLRRHQPADRGHGVRPRHRRGRPVARLRLDRAALRLRLLRAPLRVRRAPGPGRQGLRRQLVGGGDPRRPRHRHRARPPQPLPRPLGRGEPGPLPPHARRRVPGRRLRAAGEDRPRLAQHEDARPAPLPHPPRPALPDRRRLVHLPDVRLHPLPVGRLRGHHPLALHPGVREQPGALRLDPRPAPARAPPPADRVRAAQPLLHGALQAAPAGAGHRRPRLRLGRSAHADDLGAPAPRRDPDGDPRLLRPDRRRPR